MSVYLDNAASTALVPAALAAMTDAWGRPGNPMSLHDAGRQSRRLLEESRETIAGCVGARPSEVICTSGGTEADNLAVKGIYRARRAADDRRRRLVISAVEHHAVLDPAQWLADHEGAELVILPVDHTGRVDPADLRAELEAHPGQVALISVMWANNEVGTCQPIAELAALAREHDVPMHSDAVAAVGHVPVDYAASGLSAMSLSAHKFGGPQGVGALVLGRDVAAESLAHGGGHERDLRSGTQNVAGVAGMAAALRGAVEAMAANTAAVTALADRLVAGLTAIEGATVNSGDHGLPGLVHVSFAGCQGDSLLMLLDARGVQCSTGSACTAGVASASHVLLAMGMDRAAARGSLRLSLGPDNTAGDVDQALTALGEVLDRARAAGLTGVR
ncbi:cysteine desulfurase [Gordonia hirsuta DSM 44140 = NBRC 16056]|uniref:Cysteine desulfurase n=1 Tax=Gordonia hirsuta DSM 44140 = NBRC 16056 TaxID=1121927 RepID=L7L817_9ACTN|nr:cysteine desulfurase family protein [Gordonia hirsuta]GAC56168.1 cysteine desulfurase [Gordonia hirsuta DSM 44140 = NBRC 16056]